MPDRERKPLSLFFHLDPRLAENRDCFHFHVRLEDEGETRRERPIRGERETERDDASRAADISWCRPPDGCQEQFVKDTGYGRGLVCAVGKITINGNDPDEVKGKVYPPTGSIPTTPPTGDSTVKTAHLGSDIPAPINCEDMTLNFAFTSQFGNELPNAEHGPLSSPKLNRVVIWALDGATWHLGAPIQAFNGVTASVSECDATSGTTSITSGAGGPSLAIPVISAAKRYRITSQGPYPPAGTSLLMVRTGSEARTVAEWKSCAKANPGADWKLWVNSEGGRLFGTLILHSLEGNRLAVPLVWKCLDWSEHGDNDFVFSAPPRSPHAGSVLTARPE